MVLESVSIKQASQVIFSPPSSWLSPVPLHTAQHGILRQGVPDNASQRKQCFSQRTGPRVAQQFPLAYETDSGTGKVSDTELDGTGFVSLYFDTSQTILPLPGPSIWRPPLLDQQGGQANTHPCPYCLLFQSSSWKGCFSPSSFQWSPVHGHHKCHHKCHISLTFHICLTRKNKPLCISSWMLPTFLGLIVLTQTECSNSCPCFDILEPLTRRPQRGAALRPSKQLYSSLGCHKTPHV